MEHPSEGAVIERVLAALGLPLEHADEVRARLNDRDDGWRSCCGGFCDPCVLVIARAVDRVRAELASTKRDHDAASG